ncbi:hypothetical protein STCU_09567 [Strigomonas culicis]|nr:hypothetical protein STCU_09567 [Strigomonas culicis]|eukprot:EPY19220.1 hypothetical protein STCU_09567 [Strigomonas culicis]
MVELCKTYLPPDMQATLEELKEKPEELKAYGVRQVVELIRQIKAANIGCNHYHFYTINTTKQTFGALKEMGILKE